jgi:exopolysaccharide biosynthesis polyprenyl glycosylphosphotransferase
MTSVLVLIAAAAIFFALGGAWLGEALRTAGWAPGPLLGAVAVTGCWLVACSSSDLYDLRIVRSFPRFWASLPRCLVAALILLTAIHAFLPGQGTSVLIAGLVPVALLVLSRAVFYRVLRLRPFAKRTVILGTGPLAQRLIEEIASQPHCGYAIVGLVDEVPAGTRAVLGWPVLGPYEDLDRIIREVRPDRIIVAVKDRRRWLPVRQLLEARIDGVVVREGAEVYERLTGKIAIEALTPSSVIFGEGFRQSAVALAVRRVLSMVGAAVGLVALAPLFGLIALAIKLDSAGPVLFVQDRMGMGGRRFKLIKFRTMRPANGPTSEWARDNGHRVTRVGRWLRRFRFDELPQFVNVLRGDMNLVGPRPHPVTNVLMLTMVARNASECGGEIPYYQLRTMVRPGITGWAQVRYRYANDLEEEIEKMRYDLYHVKHLSLWLDLRILFETAKIILLGRGAAGPDLDRVRATRFRGDGAEAVEDGRAARLPRTYGKSRPATAARASRLTQASGSAGR